ncbi:CBS domain-containing protein [Methanonatronarchaeum sp. AMET-Sl]|uniref:CBS domain-containing protein n=1 Tax=Methanonatronarchaeum sp. AMET-Sl TaxID=3037654 RepID=UPI00244E4B2B|nr:CBS domain-containing protein [Methanonatronarchaeum sp. AMET-Sl]WGI17196.1 CBS domain-containing protein [Methanonatronarchaeum sp. AMET-Sl]
MKIDEVMNRDVITINEEDTIRDAALKLKSEEISGLPVVDEEGKLKGILSEADILSTLEEDVEFPRDLWLPNPFELVEIPIRTALDWNKYKKILKDKKEILVKEVMTSKVYTVNPNDEIYRAANLMSKHKINRLPVIENNKLIGIVAREDIIDSIVKHRYDEELENE